MEEQTFNEELEAVEDDNNEEEVPTNGDQPTPRKEQAITDVTREENAGVGARWWRVYQPQDWGGM
jgi:hypothetical protein